jgi:hypothetical protein
MDALRLSCSRETLALVIGRPDLGCAFWMRAVGSDG